MSGFCCVTCARALPIERERCSRCVLESQRGYDDSIGRFVKDPVGNSVDLGVAVAESEAYARDVSDYLAAQEARITALREAAGFFASVIKSGEPWSPPCEDIFRRALLAQPEGGAHE